MPDVVWTILADPANRPMLALTLAGLVVIVFGPWAIVKIAQRRAAAATSDPLSEAKMAKARRDQSALSKRPSHAGEVKPPLRHRSRRLALTPALSREAGEGAKPFARLREKVARSAG